MKSHVIDPDTAFLEANQLVNRGLPAGDACRLAGLPRHLFRHRTSRRYTDFIPTPTDIERETARMREHWSDERLCR
ncbi:hypothetical protein NHH03_14370 [Stieleria sp. TO1_6]|uniref:hypothetical protein n=1 Tax=Stieleria tagensis TaxID=2956795 RepID=UPI00209A816D|nr:hypothetical protein [Stieleria tagensis]MCO8122930.1 hypothetical protein [Stieleria tagensis]